MVLSWGAADEGQLGIGSIEDRCVSKPHQVKTVIDTEIKQIACGSAHTMIVKADGTVSTCGNNDYGQLGHDKSQTRAEQVQSLAAQSIQTSAVGMSHNLVVNGAGEVYSWGDNTYGQLGRGEIDSELCRVPKLVKQIASLTVIQVACGDHHSLALTSDGQVYSWGKNSHGQLGLGNNTVSDYSQPQLVSSIQGIPVCQITAGGNHCFVLSCSGALFGWGKNSFGQLGIASDSDRTYPTLCKSLRYQKIKYVACGEDHTVALTHEGGVFTFGAGMYGQLGNNSRQNEPLPKRVVELMGSCVTQIACGRRHTLTYVPASGYIYSFGLGGNGQLGLGDVQMRNSPTPIKESFISGSLAQKEHQKQANCDDSYIDILHNGDDSMCEPNSNMDWRTNDLCPANNNMSSSGTNSAHIVTRIYAGGNHSFCTVSTLEAFVPPVDLRGNGLEQEQRILRLTEMLADNVCKLKATERPPIELVDDLEKIFGSQSCINASYLLENDLHYGCNSKNHGIDLDGIRNAFRKIEDAVNTVGRRIITHQFGTQLINSLSNTPPDVEVLRLYLIIPMSHLFDQPSMYNSIICPFANAMLRLDGAAAKVIDFWLSSYPPLHFERLVYVYRQCIIHILCLPSPNSEIESISSQKSVFIAMEMLKRLNRLNETNNQIIPYHKFYIPELTEKVDIKGDYINWVQQSPHSAHKLLSFCSYPFVFDGRAKSMLLQTDAIMQMKYAIDEVYRRNSSILFLPIDPVSPCLILYVARQNLVADTISQLAKHGSADFKKPLKIIFLGEEAVDEGGVRKEFFLLILREILNPKYGMFKEEDESNLIWFNALTFEDGVMFQLIGVLCGLAIYNSTIIDLHFPCALYKKLLKRSVTLDDMKELMPVVGRSLSSLLDYENGDFEETFGLKFEVTQEVFGEVKHIELKKDGASVAVTKDNRQEYVDSYIDFIFNQSVKDQYQGFDDGFHKVCGGRSLELFQPQELQAMIVGNEDYDFIELEKNTDYKGDYHRYHQTIQIFWEVFHELPQDAKKRFLLFLTGSYRIPILGMKTVKLIVQPVLGGEEFLPVAHTCFNLLDLPKYSTKSKLKEKLLIAIENSEGFGLV